MIQKVLIVIASRHTENVYTAKEPFFHSIETPYDVVVRSEQVTNSQRNFKKWQNSFVEHPNYAYYMFLHDDCYGFQPLWLDTMLNVLIDSTNKNIGCVCHQLYSSGGYPAKYNNPPFGICNCTDEVSMYGNSQKTYDLIWAALRSKFGDKANFTDLAGGEQMLMTNEVVTRLQSIGGIPCPEDVSKWESSLADFVYEPFGGGPICERIFCGCVNSLGYRIVDCRVDNQPPFKHGPIFI